MLGSYYVDILIDLCMCTVGMEPTACIEHLLTFSGRWLQ